MYPPPSAVRDQRDACPGHRQGLTAQRNIPGPPETAPALAGQTQQVAVGGEVIKTVVMDAGVGDMRQHQLEGALAPQVDETRVVQSVAGQKQTAVLEALRPLGPPS